MNLLNKPANLIVPTLLFILLTPGLFFTLPDDRQSVMIQTLTHASLFLASYALLRTVFAAYY